MPAPLTLPYSGLAWTPSGISTRHLAASALGLESVFPEKGDLANSQVVSRGRGRGDLGSCSTPRDFPCGLGKSCFLWDRRCFLGLRPTSRGDLGAPCGMWAARGGWMGHGEPSQSGDHSPHTRGPGSRFSLSQTLLPLCALGQLPAGLWTGPLNPC